MAKKKVRKYLPYPTEKFSNPGEKNPNVRLTEEKVRAIRLLWENRDGKETEKATTLTIAKLFRVGYTTVQKVVRRQTWPDVE